MLQLSRDTLLDAYTRMRTIRDFEDRVHTEFATGAIPGFVHLYAGEEASAVGVCLNLNDADYIASTHRGHGHCIAKGCDVGGMMKEIYGRRGGLCGGKGGSMHIADLAKGMMGANGIVGGGPPLVCGAGLAAKRLGTGGVAIAFFGDGASNQGAVHESMNLASIWDLPVIFLCENNQFAVTTSYSTTVAVEHVSDRAPAYNMPGVLVDGQDAIAMYEATVEAVRRARAGEGPTLIEGLTYRFEEHSLGLGRVRRGEYRTEEDIDRWRKRDPIVIHEERLISQGIATREECDAVNAETQEEVERAVEFARNSPFPEESDLFEDMWANPIPQP